MCWLCHLTRVDRERDDRVYVLFRVAIIGSRSSVEGTDLGDNLRSTIGIGLSFECSNLGSWG